MLFIEQNTNSGSPLHIRIACVHDSTKRGVRIAQSVVDSFKDHVQRFNITSSIVDLLLESKSVVRLASD